MHGFRGELCLWRQLQLDEVGEYLQIERVVNKRDVAVLNSSGDKLKTIQCVLVKWEGVGYDQASWEYFGDPLLVSTQVIGGVHLWSSGVASHRMALCGTRLQYDPKALEKAFAAFDKFNKVPTAVRGNLSF